ncbi:MAG: glycoside hydrolase family 16 protein [Treponema sp.]|nr:glycoside hydrolase family 16 protein [Treponema sp.]
MVRANFWILMTVLMQALFFSCGQGVKSPDFVKNMRLVWSDEFNGESECPDEGNWNWSEGAHGWGNSEAQNYTKERANSYVSKGSLKIVALKDAKGKWTSARLNSRWKKAFTYGYIEFRAKVPVQKGSWPALWMMSDKAEYGQWPRSGEIDIMEHAASTWQDKTYGTAHCKAGYGGNPVKSEYIIVENIDKKWHTYGVRWTEDAITWYCDGEAFSEYKNPHDAQKSENSWPFDKDFYVIINLAMGGSLGGSIPKELDFCQMEVDYVRWYQ